MPHEQLQRALALLVTDEEYRGAIARDPDRLARELGVNTSDLDVLTPAGATGREMADTGSGPGRVGPCQAKRAGPWVVSRVGPCEPSSQRPPAAAGVGSPSSYCK